MLRIFVFGLILANILFIALNFLQPDAEITGEVTEKPVETAKLPRIELVDNTMPPGSGTHGQAAEEPDPQQVPEQFPEQVPEQFSEQVPEELAAVASEPDPAMCIRIGPFDTEAELTSLQPELERWFERVQRHETTSLVEKGYWVFLAPFATREEAEKEVVRLSSAGVKDYYVVPRGNSANAISLGVYDKKEPAENRQRQLAALGLGLEIGIEQQSESQSQYWLDAGPTNDMSPGLDQWSISHPDTRHRQIPCRALAAETQLSSEPG